MTYYRSVMVYGNDNKLLYILHPEGTVTRNEGSAGTSYTYNYFKRDQVGSTRVMLSAVNGVLQVQQSTDYYPFGLSYETNNLNKNKYLFSGKELQDSEAEANGGKLSVYDFGARQYDALIGRWITQDPMQQFFSPYVYCANNPISLIDPFGLEAQEKDTSTNVQIIDEVVCEQRKYGPNLSLINAILTELKGVGENDLNNYVEMSSQNPETGGGGSGGNGPGTDAKEAARRQRIENTKLLYDFMRKYFPNYKFSGNVMLYADPLLKSTRNAYGTTAGKAINGIYLVRISTESTQTVYGLFLTIGHELVHVGQRITVTNTSNYPGDTFRIGMEIGAYGWDVNAITRDNPNADRMGYGEQLNHYQNEAGKAGMKPGSITPFEQYGNFGMPTSFPGPKE